jgi:hypothetical protein
MTEQVFKVGQKVKIVAAGSGCHPRDIGQTVTITGIKAYGDEMGVEYDCRNLYVEQLSSSGRYVASVRMFEPIKANLSLPVFTAEGTPVEIITVSGRDKKFPVLAYEGKAKLPSKYTLEGISKSGEARRNLTNVQVTDEPSEYKEEAVEEVVLYANLYDDSERGLRRLDLGNELYESVNAATESYKEGRIENKKHPKRIGVAKVTLVKGKLPSRFNKEAN